MKILALETSTEFCSVALWYGAAMLARDVRVGQGHSEAVLPLVEELFSAAGVGVRDLDGVAFGAGPGSFTGLRIACGVAQGIAFGADLPVVPVSTLLALAHEAGAARALCCIDARMGEVYHAAYERDGEAWRAICEPGLYRPDGVPAVSGNDWTGCGSGFKAYGAALNSRYAGQLARIDGERVPRAAAIAALAMPVFAAGGGVAAEHAAPVYLRNKVALKVNER